MPLLFSTPQTKRAILLQIAGISFFYSSGICSEIRIGPHESPLFSNIQCEGKEALIAQELLRQILSGAAAQGAESNPCLKKKSKEYRYTRVSNQSRSEAPHPENELVWGPETKAEINRVYPIQPDVLAVDFSVQPLGEKKQRQSFTVLLHRSPKITKRMGCAEVLTLPQLTFRLSEKGSECPGLPELRLAPNQK